MFDVNEILGAANILAGDTKPDKILVTGKEDNKVFGNKDLLNNKAEWHLLKISGTKPDFYNVLVGAHGVLMEIKDTSFTSPFVIVTSGYMTMYEKGSVSDLDFGFACSGEMIPCKYNAKRMKLKSKTGKEWNCTVFEYTGKDWFMLPVEYELVPKNGTIVLDGKLGKSKYE